MDGSFQMSQNCPGTPWGYTRASAAGGRDGPASQVAESDGRFSQRSNSVGCEALERDSSRMTVRIRALILIVLTAGWLLPAGGFACATDASHTHVASPVAHDHSEGHSHGPSNRQPSEHSHVAATPGSSESAPASPAEDPLCCRGASEHSAAIGVLSKQDARPKATPVALSQGVPDPFQPVVLPSKAHLRLRQPPPLPYASSRRPLLI